MSSNAQNLRSLLAGGLLPVIAYTVIEETAGLMWGLVAGMAFAVGEIAWEKRFRGKVDPITWGGAAFILVLGSLSLITREGIWFRLQPALLSALLAAVCIGSVALGKPLLVALAKKQGLLEKANPFLVPYLQKAFAGLTLRVGVFFLIHAALGVWAAYAWSTRHWALLKGLGFTIGFFLYIAIETLLLRLRIKRHLSG